MQRFFLAFWLFLSVVATAATAQVASTFVPAPQVRAEVQEANGGESFRDLWTKDGKIYVVIERGSAAVYFGDATMSDIKSFCATGGKLTLAIGEGTSVTVENFNVLVGGVDSGYNCPVDVVDRSAYAFTEIYFIDRFHDKAFFTEGDRDAGMLPAIAEGKKLTGPEFFDGFTVHTHDGSAINQVFADSRSNVMAYRFISNDGLRAYIAIDRSDLTCGNSCTIGGAEVIYLHASKPAVHQPAKVHVHPAKPPATPSNDPYRVRCGTCPKN